MLPSEDFMGLDDYIELERSTENFRPRKNETRWNRWSFLVKDSITYVNIERLHYICTVLYSDMCVDNNNMFNCLTRNFIFWRYIWFLVWNTWQRLRDPRWFCVVVVINQFVVKPCRDRLYGRELHQHVVLKWASSTFHCLSNLCFWRVCHSCLAYGQQHSISSNLTSTKWSLPGYDSML